MNTTGPTNQQTSHPTSGNNNGRGRNGDTSLQAIFSSSFEAAEMENNPKAKLYELFVLIEKEFETLYAENCALRSRLAETSDKLANDSLVTGIGNTPTSFNNANNTPGSAGIEVDSKSYGKKGQFGRQKWKTAFRGQSGRLVTSLKVGSAHPDTLKHRHVQHFRGHSDGIWHITAATIGSCPLIASASADHSSRLWFANDARCIVNYVGHAGSLSTTTDPLASANQFCTAYTNSQSEENDWESATTAMVTSNEVRDDEAPAQQLMNTITPDPTRCGSAQTIQHPMLRLLGHNDVVVSGDWMYGGDHLITASWDRTANMYDAETGKIINTLSGHDQELTHCSAHNSQKLVATASKDFTFRLWDFRETIQSVAVFQGHNDAVTSVAFAATHHIASASDDRTTKVWDLRNMRSPMSTVRLNSAVNTIAVCNKQSLIAIPQDSRHISVYDIQGMRLARLPRANGKCHHRMVCCATWLPDNPVNNLITCGFDKQIVGWKFQLPHRF